MSRTSNQKITMCLTRKFSDRGKNDRSYFTSNDIDIYDLVMVRVIPETILSLVHLSGNQFILLLLRGTTSGESALFIWMEVVNLLS